MIICGIDNGVSGSIGIIEINQYTKLVEFKKTPVMEYLDYQKTKAKHILRLDHIAFTVLIEQLKNRSDGCLYIVLERPATGEFLQSMLSGIRCLEAALIVFEQTGVGYEVIDSKEWQSIMLPKCAKGDTKKVSLEVAKKLYPELDYTGFKDADGLLIGEWKLRQLMKLF